MVNFINKIDLNILHNHKKLSETESISLGERLKKRYSFSESPVQKEISPVQKVQDESLKKKYGFSEPLVQKEISLVQEVQEEIKSSTITGNLIFDADEISNEKKLKKILSGVRQLKNDYCTVLADNDENSIYFKTVDTLIKKLVTHIEKGKFSASYSAKSIEKMISSTIVKNYAKKPLKKFIDDFFVRCGFYVKKYPVGMKMKDEDFEYLSENYRSDSVDRPELDNTITENIHDAFLFDCYNQEEEEIYKKYIPADCAVGRWKE